MSIAFYAWGILAFIIGTVWFLRCLTLGRVLRKRHILTPSSHVSASATAPIISIVVAAKDEENAIESCVRSLLAQDYLHKEVIVVDDRSSDCTPAILRSLVREYGDRLQVIHVSHLPDGWQGKSHAMLQGVRASTGDWLCFTDADCTQESTKTLSVAMGEVARRKVDFLSITPMLETPTVWERIVQPVCTLALLLWFQPKRVNNRRRKNAYANGAFMLMTRDCYNAIGGHEACRHQLNEDIYMARQAKERGFHLRVVENDGLYKTRMYQTPRAAWRGWSRIFYGCLAPIGRLGPAVAFMAVFSLTPWISALAAWFMWFWGRETTWLCAALGWSAVVFCQWLVLVRYYPVLKLNRWWSLTYFLGACVTFAMLLNAVLKSWGATTTTWRGTVYRKHESTAEPAATPAPVPIAANAVESPVQHV